MECRNRVVDIQSGLYSPQRFWLIWTPRGLCLYSSWDCRFLSFFFRTQNSKRTNKQLIWIFRELVILLNELEEGRNLDTISDGVISHRDGTVVRTLASHQCVPCSIPGPGVICGLSLLLVLFLALRGFSPGTPVLSSPQKPTFSNSNSIWIYHEPLARVIAQALPVFDIKFTFTFTMNWIR